MEEKIKELILTELGLDVNKESRKREIIEARSLYFYLLKRLYPKMSLAAIGESMNKNHATVIHALNNFPMYEQYNTKLQDLKNLALHLLGEEPIEETELMKFKKKVFELENKEKPRYEIIENLYNLLEATEGTEQHNLITLRLEAFYTMNKNYDDQDPHETFMKIADDYAIEFLEWVDENGLEVLWNRGTNKPKELLQIFKKEKGL